MHTKDYDMTQLVKNDNVGKKLQQDIIQKCTSAPLVHAMQQVGPLQVGSRFICNDLDLNNFAQDDLYDPKIAVLFGSQYLGSLFKLFPGMPEAVAASYNGGEDNMARWVTRARSRDPTR